MLEQELCIKGAKLLLVKSSLVEEAANELINMLLEVEQKEGEMCLNVISQPTSHEVVYNLAIIL